MVAPDTEAYYVVSRIGGIVNHDERDAGSLPPGRWYGRCAAVNPLSDRGPFRCPLRGPLLVPGIPLTFVMGGR